MDESFRLRGLVEEIYIAHVSILVLMDESFRHQEILLMHMILVSILVLMDESFRHELPIWGGPLENSFHPCFNG
ncbi:MAG: hypothetical protein PWP15_1052 [Methanothermococcus sp.]|nr:hypothetical protein [Methanothermococcus sp.]